MSLGRIILLNGPSSAGKSTLANALREALNEPFCYFSSDQLVDGDFLAKKYAMRDSGTPSERERFIDGFHRAIAAFSDAGNDVIVEHIVEQKRWAEQLKQIFTNRDAFWVGVYAPIEVLKQREIDRGDRQNGEAERFLNTHSFCDYDMQVNTAERLESIVDLIIDRWNARDPNRKSTSLANTGVTHQ